MKKNDHMVIETETATVKDAQVDVENSTHFAFEEPRALTMEAISSVNDVVTTDTNKEINSTSAVTDF